MTENKISRRKALSNTFKGSLAAFAGFGFKANILEELPKDTHRVRKQLPMRISLNASTLLHYNIAVDEQIDMVANAGFDGVELWMRNIRSFLDNGRRRIL